MVGWHHHHVQVNEHEFEQTPGDGEESAQNVDDLGLIPGLGRSLEEGMAAHSSILAWRIP